MWQNQTSPSQNMWYYYQRESRCWQSYLSSAVRKGTVCNRGDLKERWSQTLKVNCACQVKAGSDSEWFTWGRLGSPFHQTCVSRSLSRHTPMQNLCSIESILKWWWLINECKCADLSPDRMIGRGFRSDLPFMYPSTVLKGMQISPDRHIDVRLWRDPGVDWCKLCWAVQDISGQQSPLLSSFYYEIQARAAVFCFLHCYRDWTVPCSSTASTWPGLATAQPFLSRVSSPSLSFSVIFPLLLGFLSVTLWGVSSLPRPHISNPFCWHCRCSLTKLHTTITDGQRGVILDSDFNPWAQTNCFPFWGLPVWDQNILNKKILDSNPWSLPFHRHFKVTYMR